MAHILIVDDDESYCDMLTRTVARMGHDAYFAHTLREGMAEAEGLDLDVIFLDVRLPDGNGLEALARLRAMASNPEVIILTGAGDPDGAEMAVRSGAWDYVQKGGSLKEITLPLVRALQYREEKSAGKKAVVLKRSEIVGKSPRIRAVLDLMAQAANSNANVLITGETGTGKELFARAIHDNSPRSGRSFVVVDCAALPNTLVESVLFGHEKGAFTGADRAQEGLVTQAHKGTLFLDEIGELPLSIQKAFLRVLQEKSFRPVGGHREVHSDFRLVAATNRDLDAMATKGHFREDLLFRLRAFSLELPSLRECRSDTRDLAMHYMAKLSERNNTGFKGFSPEFLNALMSYPWPGNVRELVNTLDRALAAAQHEPTLYPKHLPPHIRVHLARSAVTEDNAPPPAEAETGAFSGGKTLPTLQDFRTSLEIQYFNELMEATKGDVKAACRISGLSRSRLYDLLKKYNINRPD